MTQQQPKPHGRRSTVASDPNTLGGMLTIRVGRPRHIEIATVTDAIQVSINQYVVGLIDADLNRRREKAK